MQASYITTSTADSINAGRPRLFSGFYRSAAVFGAALACMLVMQQGAWSQTALQADAQVDPPGRVARLNLIEGPVSFADADSGNSAWTQAELNRPLTSGDRLWTGEQARSELHIGSTALRMADQTSLDFLALDDNVTQLRLAQGTIRLRVRAMFEGQRLEVNTPNLAFVITQPGDYRIDANPGTHTTRVVAQSGAGVLYGDSGTPIQLGNQQQGSFTGTNLTPAAPGSAAFDNFDSWAMARDQREDQSVSARYVPRETVGYQQLDNYGDWNQDPGYGPVWVPRAVPAGWAPYRAGHWSWISPWGWTWVDDAPWGFAPFHYGRWAQIGPRWAWVPGRLAPRPVYAPALVAFVGGNSGGVNWSISLGSGGPSRPSLGWFPLAPGEAFRPAYRVSPRYVTRINNNIVVNNTVNVTNVYRYQRQPAAVTAAAAADFARGRPVRGDAAPNATDLSRAQLVDGRRGMPARPDRADTREQGRPAAAALPPAAAAARPIVNSRADGRDDWRDSRRGDRRDARDDRQDDSRRNPPAAQAVMPAAQAATPAVRDPRTAANEETQNRLRREREQQQQRIVQRPPEQESIGQRALREQAQRERGDGRPTTPRPPDSIEQARREQAQLQREQQRLQREQVRQAEQQQRQNDESIGQRALREAAARDRQAARQQEDNRQQQQRAQQDQQRNAREQMREQAQTQAQQQRQQQQREQRSQQSEERQQSRQAHPAQAREARAEGAAGRNRPPAAP